MPGKQHVTVIAGRDGELDYSTTEFPLREGLPLAFRVGKLLGVPLGELATGVINLDTDIDEAGLGDILRVDRLGKTISEIFERLETQDAIDLLTKLLARTRRRIPGTDKFQLLEPAVIDQVYSGTGWLEAVKAAAWVVKVNWLPLSDLDTGTLQVLLGVLKSKLEKLASDVTGKPEAAEATEAEPSGKRGSRRRGPRQVG